MDEDNSWLDFLGPVGGIIGAVAGIGSERKQHNRNKELMAIQHQNQIELNKQGQKLGMQTFKQTGPEANMMQLNNAGLNPGLVYGMSGGGTGQVASPSGGNAGKGQPSMMDAGLAIQGAKTAAEIGLIKAQEDKTKAESDTITGDNERGFQEIEDLKAKVKNSNADTAQKKKYTSVLNSVEGLNIANAQAAMAKASIDRNTIEWMEKTGLNPNDSGLAKSIQFLSDKTGKSPEELIKTAIFLYGVGQVGSFFKDIYKLWDRKKQSELKP